MRIDNYIYNIFCYHQRRVVVTFFVSFLCGDSWSHCCLLHGIEFVSRNLYLCFKSDKPVFQRSCLFISNIDPNMSLDIIRAFMLPKDRPLTFFNNIGLTFVAVVYSNTFDFFYFRNLYIVHSNVNKNSL